MLAVGTASVATVIAHSNAADALTIATLEPSTTTGNSKVAQITSEVRSRVRSAMVKSRLRQVSAR